MKQLETEFIGKGEVRGMKFTQLSANSRAFLYKVEQTPNLVHYEVFRRIANEKWNCVSYPKSKSFGVWAWCITTEKRALEKFNEISK